MSPINKNGRICFDKEDDSWASDCVSSDAGDFDQLTNPDNTAQCPRCNSMAFKFTGADGSFICADFAAVHGPCLSSMSLLLVVRHPPHKCTSWNQVAVQIKVNQIFAVVLIRSKGLLSASPKLHEHA